MLIQFLIFLLFEDDGFQNYLIMKKQTHSKFFLWLALNFVATFTTNFVCIIVLLKKPIHFLLHNFENIIFFNEHLQDISFFQKKLIESVKNLKISSFIVWIL